MIDASPFTGRWIRAVVPADTGFMTSPSEHVWRLTAPEDADRTITSDALIRRGLR